MAYLTLTHLVGRPYHASRRQGTRRSVWRARGIIISTAMDLHLELVHKHGRVACPVQDAASGMVLG